MHRHKRNQMSCQKTDERLGALLRLGRAARTYFHEFSHLVNQTSYPEYANLRACLATADLDAPAARHDCAAVDARIRELVTLSAAARVYFREFDHLIGLTDYPERRELRELLYVGKEDPRRQPPRAKAAVA